MICSCTLYNIFFGVKKVVAVKKGLKQDENGQFGAACKGEITRKGDLLVFKKIALN